jgi:aminoglycoside phosphotransferase (APT) family kinase protein
MVSNKVASLGLPIPKVGEMVDYDGRTGIVYERIVGEPMLQLITNKPWTAGRYAKQLAKLQYEMHQCKAIGINSYKESLEWNINHTGALTEDKKRSILRIMEQLPEENYLCHGDFHPGNILKTAEDYVVLDWMTAASGSPSMDVARTVLLLKDAVMPGNIPQVARLVINCMRHYLLRSYLKEYKKLSGLNQEEIDCWRLPIVAARLTEWISDAERKALINEIEEALKRQ